MYLDLFVVKSVEIRFNTAKKKDFAWIQSICTAHICAIFTILCNTNENVSDDKHMTTE